MDDKHTLRSQFAADDAARTQILERARECSRLTDPTILPPLQHEKDSKLPDNYQSVGSEGVITLEGKMVSALFPPGLPWFKLELDSETMNNPEIPDEIKQGLLHDLMIMELIIVSAIESGEAGAGEEYSNTFRTSKRQALAQIIVTGDVLEYLDDDYRFTVFSRDKYVTKRNTRGDVLYHIIKEQIDPLTLTKEQFAASGLDRDEMMKLHVAKRMKDIYTNVEWMPLEKKWKIEQEVNDKIINASHEVVSPYFCTPYKLTPGEDYGRGLVELHLGDLSSFDTGCLRMLDFMELCSKMLTAIDTASTVRERDMTKKTGSVIRARVVGGVIQDIAMFKADKVADFKVCAESNAQVAARLSKVFLSASGSVRDSERTTAYEVQQATIAELEGALGGVYAPIQAHQQDPQLNRIIWMLRRDKRLPALKAKDRKRIKIKTLTGIAALADERRAQAIKELAIDAQSLGDMGIAKINAGVALDAIARYRRINEPGLIKSNEQVAQEQQAAIEAATQAAAAQKGVDVAGNVAEHALTQGTQ